MRPVFADPKTEFAFRKIFGSEEHKPLLLALLNDLLELDAEHRIVRVELLVPKRRSTMPELEYSIVNVKCVDAHGTRYVVEMQVLNVKEFDKRVVSHVATACAGQLEIGDHYPDLDAIIGMTICDFELWPQHEVPDVPMLSRWRMPEQHGGARGAGQVQFLFLELAKYDVSRPPRTAIEKWAYFFREASKLRSVPEVLAEEPFTNALEAARMARFTEAERDLYVRSGIAIQNQRGALSLARREGKEEGLRKAKEEGRREGQQIGLKEGLRKVIRRLLAARGIALSAEHNTQLAACTDLDTLECWLDRAATASSAAEALQTAAPTGAATGHRVGAQTADCSTTFVTAVRPCRCPGPGPQAQGAPFSQPGVSVHRPLIAWPSLARGVRTSPASVSLANVPPWFAPDETSSVSSGANSPPCSP